MLQLHHISLPETTVFLVVSVRKRCCAFSATKDENKKIPPKIKYAKTIVTKKGKDKKMDKKKKKRKENKQRR